MNCGIQAGQAIMTTGLVNMWINGLSQLADCTKEAAAKAPTLKERCNKRKQESAMYDMDMDCYESSEVERTKAYLAGQLSNASYTKREALAETFNMNDMPRPRTFKDLKERLAKGLWTLPAKDENEDFYDAIAYIQWRDPAKPADKEGYEVAFTKLQDAAQEAKDVIVVLDPVKGLEALKAFQATTFS